MSFLYPRTISVRRQTAQAGVGVLPYSGTQAAQETVVASGLPASIQNRGQANSETNLPSDPKGGAPRWRILIPRGASPLGQITERDVIVDDLGKRYLVIAAYWNSLGHNLHASLLEP